MTDEEAARYALDSARIDMIRARLEAATVHDFAMTPDVQRVLVADAIDLSLAKYIGVTGARKIIQQWYAEDVRFLLYVLELLIREPARK